MSDVPLNHRAERVNRTCEACRRRKIRCKRDAETPVCERCIKLGLDCIFAPPAIRKKRGRKESQIRELEEKLDWICKLVTAEQTTPPPAGNLGSVLGSILSADLGTSGSFAELLLPAHDPNLAVSTSQTACGSGSSIQDSPLRLIDDTAARSATGLHESQIQELCVRFCEETLPFYPFVLIDNPFSLPSLRHTRPALFRAILAAASSCFQPELSQNLYRDAEKYISEQAVINGQKSLDLVQGALILAVWSRAPTQFTELNFGQFANIAASTVLDLRSSNEEQRQTLNSGSMESRLEVARTYAATYLLCSGIAMSYHRPTVLQYGSWIEACISMLQSSPAHKGDLRLAAWTQLQRLAEQGLHMAGLDVGELDQSDNSCTNALLTCSIDQIRRWRQAIPEDIMSGTLAIHYQVVMLNLSVPGLHSIHDNKDFKPPFAIHSFNSGLSKSHIHDYDSWMQFMNSRTRCLTIAKDIIDLFLTFPTDDLRKIPVIVYTRVMYASVVIMKLDICNNPALGDLQANLEDAISALDLLETVVYRLEQANDNRWFAMPSIFHSTLKRMICWGHEAFTSLSQTSESRIEPLKDLRRSENEEHAALPLNAFLNDVPDHPIGFDADDTEFSGGMTDTDAGVPSLDGYTGTVPSDNFGHGVWIVSPGDYQ